MQPVDRIHIYHRVFTADDGKAILDDLAAKFGRPCFDADNARKTDYNLGARAVLDFINRQCEANK
jgi:hypothetical protein